MVKNKTSVFAPRKKRAGLFFAVKKEKKSFLEEINIMAKKYCYLFTEGNAKMREILGGKGANLAEMTNIGLPVPQGFTISTEACTQYYEDGRQINPDIQAEIMEYIEKMENICGMKFGDKENPLLVSVRSGARASMPGMMDTILNLGLNECLKRQKALLFYILQCFLFCRYL